MVNGFPMILSQSTLSHVGQSQREENDPSLKTVTSVTLYATLLLWFALPDKYHVITSDYFHF